MLTRAASVLFIALAAFAFLASSPIPVRAKGFDTGPPAGVTTTTATLAQVLSAYEKARGKGGDDDGMYIEDGTLTTSSQSGVYHDVSAGGDYANTTTFGPFVTRDGVYKGQEWDQDENGQVVNVEGIHERGSVDARALASALEKPNDSVKLLGETSSPVGAYVVEVNPPDGRREWVFFDKTTHLIDRSETIYSSSRVVRTYADFRTRNGETEPWSGHYSDGNSVNDEDWHITKMQRVANPDPNQLTIPTSRPFIEFPAGTTSVKLPTQLVDSDIIITLTINGKGYDFLLDSGSSAINVDYAAAKAMGLTLYGQSSEVAAGRFNMSQAMIPEIDVGPLKMRNVAVDVIPFSEQENQATEIVGLVGYDFIAGMELRVDYDNRAAYAMAPGQYQPPASAFVVPAALDDRIPVVAAQIGNAIGQHFVIDTGANKGFIFPGFASEHPQDIADRGGGRTISSYEPFMYASGVGGEVSLKPTEVSQIRLGGVAFEDWLVYLEPGATGLENEDYDGLLGYDFLRYFNLVFDYADALIFLEPNDTFKRNVTH